MQNLFAAVAVTVTSQRGRESGLRAPQRRAGRKTERPGVWKRRTRNSEQGSALYRGIEGEDWEEMYFSYKEMSRAVRVRKPQEDQKAKALWKMKAAKDAREEYYDSTREVGIKGRNERRLALWEEHLKKTIVALDKALKCVEDQH